MAIHNFGLLLLLLQSMFDPYPLLHLILVLAEVLQIKILHLPRNDDLFCTIAYLVWLHVCLNQGDWVMVLLRGSSELVLRDTLVDFFLAEAILPFSLDFFLGLVFLELCFSHDNKIYSGLTLSN